jgi:hypothetical protein
MNISIQYRSPDKMTTDTLSSASSLSEIEYLTHEASVAETSLRRSFNELSEDTAANFSARHWIKYHPWRALGIGALSGFAAAAVATPRRSVTVAEAETLKKPSPQTNAAVAPTNIDAVQMSRQSGSINAFVVSSLLTVAKVIVEGLTVEILRKHFKLSEPAATSPSMEVAGNEHVAEQSQE